MNWYKKSQIENVPDKIQKMFGLWNFEPKPPKYQKCPKCKQNKARWVEDHPDTDMNEMVLRCLDCGDIT